MIVVTWCWLTCNLFVCALGAWWLNCTISFYFIAVLLVLNDHSYLDARLNRHGFSVLVPRVSSSAYIFASIKMQAKRNKELHFIMILCNWIEIKIYTRCFDELWIYRAKTWRAWLILSKQFFIKNNLLNKPMRTMERMRLI